MGVLGEFRVCRSKWGFGEKFSSLIFGLKFGLDLALKHWKIKCFRVLGGANLRPNLRPNLGQFEANFEANFGPI